MIRLEDIAKGDRWPFHQFRLWENKLVSGVFVKREIDLATDFTSVKYTARHESNMEDLNDEAKNDISGDVVFDGGGLCHYEWGETPETDVVGKYIGRLWGTRVSGKKWHSPVWYYFYITDQQRLGRTT